MMMRKVGDKYLLPENWQPQFKKSYESEDKRFEVWLSYEGLQNPVDSAPMHVWITALVTRGIILDAAPFWWDPSDRELTYENVANHMITWWKDADFGKLLEEATLVEKPEDYDPKIRAVALVDTMFYPTVDVDFEILWFAKIGKSWKVLLTTTAINGKDESDGNYYEVVHDVSKETTQVTAYGMVDEVEVPNEHIESANLD